MARKAKAEMVITCEEPKKTPPKLKVDDITPLEPLTDNQVKFFKAYDRGDYFMILHGVPGSGKSLISLAKSITEVLTKGNPYHKVVVVRSAVQGRDQGFLPGDVAEKMNMYELPYQQICKMLFGRKDAWDILKLNDRAEFLSTSFIRGITLDNSIVIADEFQNFSYDEIRTVLTRIGKNSKIIFCGDILQSDLNKNKNDVSGLPKFMSIADLMPCVTKIEFGIDDIVRSGLIKDFILAELQYDSLLDSGVKP